jgi:DNA-binding MarR family transcriptional regulator
MTKAYDKSQQRNLKIIIATARLIRKLDSVFSPDLARIGLTPSQFSVLETLYHKGELCINELIEKTLTTSGNITVVIQNLTKAGLVLKQVSHTDRRSRTLSLTEKGRELIAVYFPEHLELLDKTLTGLSKAEKEQLISLARKLTESIGELE